jgi:hypothetical protein
VVLLHRDSSRAAWVFGGVRLISSARITFAKIGPGKNRNTRSPVALSCWMTSVPVMSDGMRSGVNWMRLNVRFRILLSVEIISVFASPGTPISRLWPRQNNAMNNWSTTSSCPTITLPISDFRLE